MAKLVIMPVAAVLVLLFAGVAQATTCPAGYKDCDKDWYKNECEVNVNTDVNNCGDCGNKCGALCGANAIPVCKEGKCDFTCKEPFLNCDGDWKNGCEVEPSQDVNNCGACWKKCVAPLNSIAKCNGGKCDYTCKPGYFNCDGDWKNGCEGFCGSDVNNCGTCGNKCPDVPNAVTKCNGGKCDHTCKPGYFNCDGDWKNGCEGFCGSDVNNCGTCGNKCPDVPNAVTKCNGGKCDHTCKPGYFNCDGDWKNGCEGFCGSDVNNCGTCGNKCKDVPNAVTKCNGGQCYHTCKPGYFNCDGKWWNGCEGFCGSDVNNCGACGNKCKDVPNAVTKCNGGQCDYFCKPGYVNCDGKWWNGCECQPGTDSNNCGGCGKKCPTPTYAGGEAKCTYGRCETQSCKRGWNWENKKKCCVNGPVKKCLFFICW